MGFFIDDIVADTVALLKERDRLRRWQVWRRFLLTYHIELNYDNMTVAQRKLAGQLYSDHLDIVRSA